MWIYFILYKMKPRLKISSFSEYKSAPNKVKNISLFKVKTIWILDTIAEILKNNDYHNFSLFSLQDGEKRQRYLEKKKIHNRKFPAPVLLSSGLNCSTKICDNPLSVDSRVFELFSIFKEKLRYQWNLPLKLIYKYQFLCKFRVLNTTRNTMLLIVQYHLIKIMKHE